MSGAAVQTGVVIVAYNSADVIGPCLESLKTASRVPVHIVVVDNASTDGTAEVVAQNFPAVTLIRNAANRYYAAANNQGAEHAGGENILLLNPDVVLPVEAIDAMTRILHEQPRCAAVAPMLIDPAGHRQRSLRELPGLDTLWYDLLGLAFLLSQSRRFGRWRMGYFDGKSAIDVQQPMASCLLIRQQAIAELGLFDKRYPMFFNDVDWCRRAHDAGWTIRYVPNVQVRHVGGASTRQRKVKMIWMSHAAYYRYLRQYNCRGGWRRPALWLTAPFLWGAAILRTIWWGARRIVG